MRLLRIAPLPAAALLLVGCGGEVPASDIEESRTTEMESAYGVEVTDASCDGGLAAEEGETTDCTATVDGEEIEVLVTADSVEDDEVYMTFEPQN